MNSLLSASKQSSLFFKSTMPPKNDYVQRLLQAEENRNQIIAEARARKQAKMKQAKTDAEKAVKDFKNEKDAELKKYTETLAATSEGEKAGIINETERQITDINRIAAERLPIVVDQVVNMVCTSSA